MIAAVAFSIGKMSLSAYCLMDKALRMTSLLFLLLIIIMFLTLAVNTTWDLSKEICQAAKTPQK